MPGSGDSVHANILIESSFEGRRVQLQIQTVSKCVQHDTGRVCRTFRNFIQRQHFVCVVPPTPSSSRREGERERDREGGGGVKGEGLGLSRPDSRTEVRACAEDGERGKPRLLAGCPSCVPEEAPAEKPLLPLLSPAFGPCAVCPSHTSSGARPDGAPPHPSSQPHLPPPLSHSASPPLLSGLPAPELLSWGAGHGSRAVSPQLFQSRPSHPSGPAGNSALDSPSPGCPGQLPTSPRRPGRPL